METELSNEERLKFISDMIVQAKKNFAGGGSFHFLLWGWVISLANLGHYVLDVFELYEMPYIVWLVTIPAAILSTWYGITKSKKAQVTSHLDKVYSSLWISISVMVVICLLFMVKINFNHNPFILLFTGLGTFISGILMRYRPIMFGGVILWTGAVMGLFSPVTDQQLIAGIVVILGHLVPGYLLKKAEKAHV